ncbi:MAG: hypothetical protein AAFN67_03195, partial [Pseudomonadota bacterium]
MSDLIEVIDDVLPPELCKQLMERFESSPNLSQGRTGGGVDLDKKRSMDVSISRNPEFKDLFQQVMQHTGQQLVSYIEKYYFALVGPIGLTVRHPKTGEPVKVTGENFDEVGKPNLANLVNYHCPRCSAVHLHRQPETGNSP